MRTTLLVLLALVGVVLLPVTPASHGDCRLTTSTPTLTVGAASGDSVTVYVAVDTPTQRDVFVPLPWIYVESNGRDGLQRNDDFKDDTCGGEYPGDTLML